MEDNTSVFIKFNIESIGWEAGNGYGELYSISEDGVRLWSIPVYVGEGCWFNWAKKWPPIVKALLLLMLSCFVPKLIVRQRHPPARWRGQLADDDCFLWLLKNEYVSLLTLFNSFVIFVLKPRLGSFGFLGKGAVLRIWSFFFLCLSGGETIDAWSDYSIASAASSPPSSSIPGVSQDLKASTSFVRTSISSCRSRASVISMSMFLIQWQLHQVFPASKNPTYWWGLVAVEGDGLRVICCWYQ